MAQTTPNLQLTVWNNLSDPYDSGQLANNFVKIDLHDHSGSGKGVQIDGATGIKANSISSVQMGQSAIGSSELKSDSNNPGADSNRAVGTNHIQNLAVTANKIANGTITRAKLNRSDVLAVPVVYHTDSKGSLPTVAVDGEALYDGYVIDYAFTVTTTTSSSDIGQSVLSTANSKNYIWRFRYNDSDSTWDFIGGNPIILNATEDLTGVSPSNGSLYAGWGAKMFQSIYLPFKGTYEVTAGGLGDIASGSTAVFRSALGLGARSGNSPVTSGLIPYAYASGYSKGVVSTTTDAASAIISNIPVTVTSNTTDANLLSQLFGFAGQTSTPNGVVRLQRMIVRPNTNITNFS